jgi:hypothetical protein
VTVVSVANGSVFDHCALLVRSSHDSPSLHVAPIALVAYVPFVLTADPEARQETVPELIALAKASPETISFVSAAVPTTPQPAAYWNIFLSGLYLECCTCRSVRERAVPASTQEFRQFEIVSRLRSAQAKRKRVLKLSC